MKSNVHIEFFKIKPLNAHLIDIRFQSNTQSGLLIKK